MVLFSAAGWSRVVFVVQPAAQVTPPAEHESRPAPRGGGCDASRVTEASEKQHRIRSGSLCAASVPVATVIAFVFYKLGLPWIPTWFFCILGVAAITLTVVLYRGVRGPDRSPHDRPRRRS